MHFKMKSFSLYNRLLLWFLIVGIFPFFLFYLYTIYWAEDKIIEKIIKEQHYQAKKSIESIETHFQALYNEVLFLSNVDIMDDIIAQDIDKRITRVLIQKKKDINLDLDFFVIGMQGNVIATSSLQNGPTKFLYLDNLQKAFLNSKKYFFIGQKLYIYHRIFASFAPEKELGFLIVEYSLKNLELFFTKEEGVHTTLINFQNNIYIGDKLSFEIEKKHLKSDFILDEYLVTLEKMPSIMQKWYFIYYKDKKVALNFLYDFLYFMLAMIPIVVIFIIIIGVMSTKSIIRPIKYLTKSAEEITKTKDYTKSLEVDSNDEIGRFSYAFNELLQETNRALESLTRENRLRLKRFIELIEIFNAIMQTKTENECIETSINKMKQLTQAKELYFCKVKNEDEDTIPLYVTDFEASKKLEYGHIVIDIKGIEDVNEYKFYNSIASMISLQLDRIRLIDKTLMASNAKSSFISNMSHELRTPLNSIISSTQYLIRYESLSDEQQDMMANVENSAQYLLEMINGILDIAKIEAGKMDVNYQSFNLVEVMQEIISMFMPLAEQKDLELKFTLQQIRNENLTSDIKLVKQVIINLLSNAIKFTHSGSIEIELIQEDEAYKLFIKDSGIGIDPEKISKLFHDFVQLRNSEHKEYQGTGLGLSLSKKLANLLDGDITIESQGVGHGSVALFIIKNQS